MKNIFSIFLGKIGYYGCTMLIERELLKIILPIPYLVEAHDLWIALIANITKTNLHSEYISIKEEYIKIIFL